MWKRTRAGLRPIIIWDTETTGLAPKENRLVEIGLMELPCTSPYKNVFTFSSLIFPTGLQQPRAVNRVNGITNPMMQDAPQFTEVWHALKDFVNHISLGRGTPIFIAHNLTFDKAFLREELKRIGEELPKWDFACSLRDVAHVLWPGERASLAALTEKFQIKNHEAHRALSDVIATSEFLEKADLLLRDKNTFGGAESLLPGEGIRNMIQFAAERRRSQNVSDFVPDRGFPRYDTTRNTQNLAVCQNAGTDLQKESDFERRANAGLSALALRPGNGKKSCFGNKRTQGKSLLRFSRLHCRERNSPKFVGLRSKKFHRYDDCFSLNRSLKVSKLSEREQKQRMLLMCHHCNHRSQQEKITYFATH